MLTCGRCGEEKPNEAFSPSNRTRTSPWWRSCYKAYNAERWAARTTDERERAAERQRRWKAEHREELAAYYRDWNAARPGYKRANRVLREYGLTIEQVEQMEVEQGGVCAICQQPPSGRGRNGARLHIDHCHATGRVRGLLCSPCNTALGQLADDPERMQRMIDYVTKDTT